MRSETLSLPGTTQGTHRTVTVQRFGTPGGRPRVHIQASLHADEIPAMLVADKLRRHLTKLEAEGRLVGEVVLVPIANPIGLSQAVLGDMLGRFDLTDGRNFNRDFPWLAPAAAARVQGRLGDDPAANTALIRSALADALSEMRPQSPAQHLKVLLMSLAVGADWVLDLHCDHEAVMHLYTLTPLAAEMEPLARLLGAQALLTADESGDHPFDEAVSRPWTTLQKRFPDHPIPLACRSVTVELRGQADVDHDLADRDARALVDFLAHAGVLTGPVPTLPPSLCAATPLEAVEPLTAPAAGVLVYRRPLGAAVEEGEIVADIIDPVSGQAVPVISQGGGLLFARIATRMAFPGNRLGKLAGTRLRRSGNLLSP